MTRVNYLPATPKSQLLSRLRSLSSNKTHSGQFTPEVGGGDGGDRTVQESAEQRVPRPREEGKNTFLPTFLNPISTSTKP